jgi:hypothetical protein
MLYEVGAIASLMLCIAITRERKNNEPTPADGSRPSPVNAVIEAIQYTVRRQRPVWAWMWR